MPCCKRCGEKMNAEYEFCSKCADKEYYFLDSIMSGKLKLPQRTKEKWIEIEITIMVPDSEIIKAKSALEPYAKKLNWNIESGKITKIIDNTEIGGDKNNRVSVNLAPSNKYISPIEFLKNKDKIFGLAFSILRDFIYNGDNAKAMKNFSREFSFGGLFNDNKKSRYDNIMFTESIACLHYKYGMMDRVNFEKRNKNLAIKLFGSTVKEDLKKYELELDF